MAGCPNCGFTSDPETGAVYDVTYPCPRCGLGGARVTHGERVAARFIHATGYFSVGDYVWMGKYKNKLGQVIAFGQDDKGNPTITIRPVPQGRKQDKTFSLFKVWKVRPEQMAELKAKGKLSSMPVRKPTPSQIDYARHLLKQQGLPEPEDGLESMTSVTISELIDGLKKKRGTPIWYGNGQFGGWRKDAVEGDDHDFDE